MPKLNCGTEQNSCELPPFAFDNATCNCGNLRRKGRPHLVDRGIYIWVWATGRRWHHTLAPIVECRQHLAFVHLRLSRHRIGASAHVVPLCPLGTRVFAVTLRSVCDFR